MIVSWFGFLPSRVWIKFSLELRLDCFWTFQAVTLYKYICILFKFCCNLFKIVSVPIGCSGLDFTIVRLRFILELRLICLVEFVAVVC